MGDQSMGSPSRSDGSARSAQDPKPPEEGDEAKARSSASSPMREDGETDGDDRVVRVSNLTRIVNHKHLEEIFAHYGAVERVALERFRPDKGDENGGDTSNLRAGFVQYVRAGDATNAMSHMDGGQIDGKEVTLTRIAAVPREATRPNEHNNDRGRHPNHHQGNRGNRESRDGRHGAPPFNARGRGRGDRELYQPGGGRGGRGGNDRGPGRAGGYEERDWGADRDRDPRDSRGPRGRGRPEPAPRGMDSRARGGPFNDRGRHDSRDGRRGPGGRGPGGRGGFGIDRRRFERRHGQTDRNLFHAK